MACGATVAGRWCPRDFARNRHRKLRDSIDKAVHVLALRGSAGMKDVHGGNGIRCYAGRWKRLCADSFASDYR
jgi:hypothetical protein